MEEQAAKKTFWEKTKRVLSYIFVEGMSGMALGLFATLIIGTIIENVGKLISGSFENYIVMIGQVAKFMMGAGIGLGMGYKLKKAPLVSISAGVVGMLASFAAVALKEEAISFLFWANAASSVAPTYKTSVGEPLCAFIASFVALEVGALVSGKTKVDIIVTPLVGILSGATVALLSSIPLSAFISFLSKIIAKAGEQQPLLMGILVAVLMGVFLTLPISSAAIGVMLQLNGVVAGAAVVGCCCQMVGYAVMSFRENKWGGLVAQGIGTSMLQMPNLVKKPILWLPPIIASAILGPISSVVLGMTSTPVGSGMGTAGLVGVIETFTAMSATQHWGLVLLQIIGIDILAPAVICLLISEFMRKKGWIKEGDLKLDL
ncbi:MAG: PTS sugar transporter subunit IIC [Clostridia bacterium]|nr:PTS sugar transporter subunit IIC [Clostridia bacterium]